MNTRIEKTLREPTGDTTRARVRARGIAGIAPLLLVIACGGNGASGGSQPADTCSSFAGTYSVTTEIVSTTCPVGLHAITEPITWTFVQTAPSCSFTMTNSLYPSSEYSGHFTMQGSDAKVVWTTVTPAPTVGGGALTYTSEDLTIQPAVAPATPTLSGSFAWNNAYPCDGTTNVCSGSVAAGCVSPN
jgi:hypothetical protein